MSQIPNAKLCRVRDIQTGEETYLLLADIWTEKDENGYIKLQMFEGGGYNYYEILEELGANGNSSNN